MKKRKLFTILCAVVLSVSASITSLAGAWAFDGPENWQWKYVNDDGTLAAPGWHFIDGFWYHLDENNYLDIGLHSIDNEGYYFSRSEESLGQMWRNAGYLTGYFGDDGAWRPNESPETTWMRWKYGGWTEADTISWTAQFAAYNVGSGLFMPYNAGTVGQTFQLRYPVPGNNDAVVYDIGNTLVMQLYMVCDASASWSWVTEVDGAGNLFIVFDYTYYE